MVSGLKVAPMGLGQLTGDGQAQPTASLGAAASAVGAVETLKDVGQRFGGDAWATVVHRQPDETPLAIAAHTDDPTLWGIAQGIGKQVRDNLFHPQRVKV